MPTAVALAVALAAVFTLVLSCLVIPSSPVVSPSGGLLADKPKLTESALAMASTSNRPLLTTLSSPAPVAIPTACVSAVALASASTEPTASIWMLAAVELALAEVLTVMPKILLTVSLPKPSSRVRDRLKSRPLSPIFRDPAVVRLSANPSASIP